MPLTPDERVWLQEQWDDLKREHDDLVSGKAWPGYTDRNERRLDLLEQLEEIERQLREGKQSASGG